MQDNYKQEDNGEEINISLVQDDPDGFVENAKNFHDNDSNKVLHIGDDGSSSSSPRYVGARNLGIGVLSAAPTIALTSYGSGHTTVLPLVIYIVLLLLTSVPAFYLRNKHGVLCWFVGFFSLAITSAFKSGFLLAPCDNFTLKAALYAITALWECSNAVLIIGGSALLNRFGVHDLHRAILYASAPSQLRFVTGDEAAEPGHNLTRSIHIIMLCPLGLAPALAILGGFEQIRNSIVFAVVLELELLALIVSFLVLVLDLPAHLWQCIFYAIPSQQSTSVSPRVILPYGWVYSTTSTRQFWSRWSRPATQLIRHLLYHPLGGRNRWYLSIPIMFGLNATSHYDLSFSLVGDRAEVWWNSVFGALAVVAMFEVVGDSYFCRRDEVGDIDSVGFPKWYVWTRTILLHLSLRLVLYIVVYKCFQISLKDFFLNPNGENGNDDWNHDYVD